MPLIFWHSFIVFIIWIWTRAKKTKTWLFYMENTLNKNINSMCWKRNGEYIRRNPQNIAIFIQSNTSQLIYANCVEQNMNQHACHKTSQNRFLNESSLLSVCVFFFSMTLSSFFLSYVMKTNHHHTADTHPDMHSKDLLMSELFGE